RVVRLLHLRQPAADHLQNLLRRTGRHGGPACGPGAVRRRPALRPLGALIFGGLGDRVGRKAAFLITVSLMGGSTFAIGLLPTFAQVGQLAPVLLILLRVIQATALGGQYGGAAIYVAEHAPSDRRGYMTSWVQTSAAFGLVG